MGMISRALRIGVPERGRNKTCRGVVSEGVFAEESGRETAEESEGESAGEISTT